MLFLILIALVGATYIRQNVRPRKCAVKKAVIACDSRVLLKFLELGLDVNLTSLHDDNGNLHTYTHLMEVHLCPHINSYIHLVMCIYFF